jgi:hypothetical protein
LILNIFNLEILMNNKSNLSALLVALMCMMMSGLAAAEVTANTPVVKSVSVIPQSLTSAIKSYKTAVTAEEKLIARQNLIAAVSSAVLSNPANAAALTTAAVTAAPDLAGSITAAAIKAAPQQTKAIITAALTVPGVNPADVTAPTAAGPDSGRGQANRGETNRGDFKNSHSTPPGSGGGKQASPS